MAAAESSIASAFDRSSIPIEYIGDRLQERPARWPVRPPPMPDELLSSWLNRVAVANGMGPWSFYMALSQATGASRDRCFWLNQVDLLTVRWMHWADACCNKQLAGYLADRTGIDEKLIRSMSLQRPSDATAQDRTPSGTLQWILLEVMPNLLLPEAREIEKVRASMRFCPHCLAEWQDPWFRKFWRTSLASICIRHRCSLLSTCRCGADVQPHLSREARSQAFCYSCGNDLRSMQTQPASPLELNRQAEINRRTFEGVETILASGGSGRSIVRHMTRPVDHTCKLRRAGMIDALTRNLPISLLLAYQDARRLGAVRKAREARRNRHSVRVEQQPVLKSASFGAAPLPASDRSLTDC